MVYICTPARKCKEEGEKRVRYTLINTKKQRPLIFFIIIILKKINIPNSSIRFKYVKIIFYLKKVISFTKIITCIGDFS